MSGPSRTDGNRSPGRVSTWGNERGIGPEQQVADGLVVNRAGELRLGALLSAAGRDPQAGALTQLGQPASRGEDRS